MLLWQINSCKLAGYRKQTLYADLFKPAVGYYSCAVDTLIDVFDKAVFKHTTTSIISELKKERRDEAALCALLIDEHQKYKELEEDEMHSQQDLRLKSSSEMKDTVWNWLMQHDLNGFGMHQKGSANASLCNVIQLLCRSKSFKEMFSISVSYKCGQNGCFFSEIEAFSPICLVAENNMTISELIRQTINKRCSNKECPDCNYQSISATKVSFGEFLLISFQSMQNVVEGLTAEEQLEFDDKNFQLRGAVWSNNLHYIPIAQLSNSDFVILDDLADHPKICKSFQECLTMMNCIGLSDISWLIYQQRHCDEVPDQNIIYEMAKDTNISADQDKKQNSSIWQTVKSRKRGSNSSAGKTSIGSNSFETKSTKVGNEPQKMKRGERTSKKTLITNTQTEKSRESDRGPQKANRNEALSDLEKTKKQKKEANRIRKAKSRSAMTAEKKAEDRASNRIREAKRRSEMSEGEKANVRASKRIREAKRSSEMSEGEKADVRASKRISEAKRSSEMSESKKADVRESKKTTEAKRRSRLSDERKNQNDHLEPAAEATDPNSETFDNQSGIEENTDERNKHITESIENVYRNFTPDAFLQCISCHKILYLEKLYHTEIDNKSTNTLNIDHNSILCWSCKQSLSNNTIPTKAAINDLFVSDCPQVLKKLTFLEKRFVCRIITYMTMLVLPGGQYAQKGMAIHFPIEPQNLVQILPQNCADNGLVCTSGSYESFIRPMVIFAALEWLRKHHKHYSDIKINYDAFNLSQEKIDDVLSQIEETASIPIDYDCPEISVDEFLKHNGSKFTFPRSTESPVSLLGDDGTKETQAFPHLFTTGKYSYGAAKLKAPKLTLLQYIQSRLLNIDPRFRLDIPFLITSVNRYETSATKSLVQCFMRVQKPTKDGSNSKESVTAGDVRNISQNKDLADNSLMWMKSIRGSASYWKDQLYDLLAKITTLGPPDVFVTQSSAEMHWPELKRVLERDVGPITDISDAIRKNPVIVAKYIEKRFQRTLKSIIDDKDFGTVTDYHVRLEFQNRGSAHYHCFLWILDAPSIHKGSAHKHLVEYIDKIICTTIPDKDLDPELHDLVMTRQIHNHTDYCQTKGKKCRFNYPRRPCEATRILPDFDATKTKTNFYETKRTKESESVNAYNPKLLRKIQAHIDVQLVYGAQGLAYYVCKYVMKAEPDELRTGLANTLREMSSQNLSKQGRMIKMGMCLLKYRRMSAQEAAYRICHLPMVYSSRDVFKVPTQLPDKRVKLLKNKAEIAEMDDEETDIFHDSFVDVYRKRPKSLESQSLHDIASWYEKKSYDTPNSLPLIDESASLKRRRKFRCIRTSFLSSATDEYYYSLLLLYLPHRTEAELKGNYENYRDSFNAKHEEFNFENITNQCFVNEVFNAAQRLRVEEELQHMNDQNEQNDRTEPAAEFDGDYDENPVEIPVMDQEDIRTYAKMNESEERQWHSLRVGQMPVATLEEKLKSLTESQRDAIKYLHMTLYQNKEQLLMLLQGEAGSGKSYLLRVLKEWLCLTRANYAGHDPIILGAPTGLAAKQIKGRTLHSLLKLPIQKKGDYSTDIRPLTQMTLRKVKQMFDGKQFLFVDECSMVGKNMLLAVNKRLCQVFGNEKPFGGLHVIFCGDQNQLRPVLDKHGFKCEDLYDLFQPIQLTQNMRQSGDKKWCAFLNNVRNGLIKPEDKTLIESRLFSEEELRDNDAVRIYPTKAMVDKFNAEKQADLDPEANEINSIDIYSPNDIAANTTASENDIPSDDRDAGGLQKTLTISVNTRVMLIKNIASDLVNGDIGCVSKILSKEDGKVEKIFIKFDDKDCGKDLQTCDKSIPFERVYTEYTSRGRSINRYQFPLIPAWAITIHKSQGLSLDKAVVNIGQKIFEHGQSYVALSRIRTLEGAFIEKEQINMIIRRICNMTNKEVHQFNLKCAYEFREIKDKLKNYKMKSMF